MKHQYKDQCSILLVEDSDETRELYSLALAGEEFELRSCSNAAEALTLLESGYIPDLIICDLLMPGLDGDQFVALLRRNERWSKIRVIIVSGVDNVKKRASDMGANGYLRKPFSLESLEAIVSDNAKVMQNA